MLARIVLTVVLIVVAVLLGSCDTADEAGVNEDGTLPPVAATAAERALGERLSISTEKIDVVSYDRVEWSDSCLGIIGAEETCTPEPVVGWRVILSVDGDRYVYHTDYDGTAALLVEGPDG